MTEYDSHGDGRAARPGLPVRKVLLSAAIAVAAVGVAGAVGSAATPSFADQFAVSFTPGHVDSVSGPQYRADGPGGISETGPGAIVYK